MSCPDTDRILELTLHDAADLEAAAHVQECADCRALVRIVLEARHAYEPDLRVPDALVARTVDSLVAAARAAGSAAGSEEVGPVEPGPVDVRGLAASFLLGAATVTVAAFGTGSVGGGSLVPLVVTAALAGTVAAVWEGRQAESAPSAG